ncbi:hypothetical protein [Helicobacter cetorum]|uniref:hypothetical protein n=1 Tax=Helicobacter cetorum TaxID=138563 RepID=UPI000CF178FE|nr:hypothetical protein [Helicobacter cetorum]
MSQNSNKNLKDSKRDEIMRHMNNGKTQTKKPQNQYDSHNEPKEVKSETPTEKINQENTTQNSHDNWSYIDVEKTTNEKAEIGNSQKGLIDETDKEKVTPNSDLGEDMRTKERFKKLEESMNKLFDEIKNIKKDIKAEILNEIKGIKREMHDEISEIKKDMPKRAKLENIEESVDKLHSSFKDAFKEEGIFQKLFKKILNPTQSNTDSKYKQKCEELDKKMSQGAKEYKQLKETNESLEKEINKLESQTKDLARELKDKENKLHQEKNRATSLENDKEHLENTLKQKEKEITALRSDLKTTQSDLQNTKNNLKDTQSNLQTTKENLKDTQKELQDTTETLKNTTSLLKNTEQNLSALKQQHENLRKEFFVDLYEGYKRLDSDFRKSFLVVKDNNAINFFKTLYAPNVLGNFYEQIEYRIRSNEDITLLKDYFERLFEVFAQDFNLERLTTQQGDRYESSKHANIVGSGISGKPIEEVLLLGFKYGAKTYQSLVKI